ncbi:adaptin N terminal region-domain-containing protein [Zopfochytrium polystomum]|nr:adaptin N terminal region-domain-containing protein [Zopfochytrium polystomum]
MNFGKKDDEDSGLFSHIDKSTVLQEARAFNESPINPRKCRTILTKILYLLYQSETFQTKEATETFFSITKLFQSQDIPLRQVVYLVIKELSKVAEDVIMVTSSLSKDMNSKSDQVKANAIRALCKITESSMLQGIERLLKQAIVDKNPSISSAALVSSLHLFNGNREVVKRWANEVQEAINSKGAITQYHALGLIYQIRQHDRMAVIKLIQNYARSQLRSPFAYCMLVRFVAKIMDEDDSARRSMYEILEGWLRHRNDMVVYEAARAICDLRNVTNQELFPAVSALQLMLVNHKPTLRFAAIRTLNKLAMTHPASVSPCNLDMENLITDSNRSIATFAITTLLKTGNEASVDRLMKQISGFMTEISDEFKIIVVEAIRSLCLKFPTKQSVMINFLSNILRDEGGYEYKRAIVDAIFDIIYHIPESKEYALSHLCEFIEDCEFTKLAVRVLHLLGSEGPKSATPSKFIRYIYNRIILENATVKAAAVCAMARFAIEIEELRPRIQVLLTRALDDNDDEVRDRAAMFLRILASPELCEKYSSAANGSFSWAALEVSLLTYLGNEEALHKPFDINAIPTVTRAEEAAEKLRKQTALQEMPSLKSTASAAAASRPSAPPEDPQTATKQAMERIPQLAVLGNLLKSSKPVDLTESETEYVVSAVKHIFPQHLVFQFNCRNTLNEFLLENVTVETKVKQSDDETAGMLVEESVITLPQLVFDVPGSVYVVFKRPNGITPSATFSNTLKFTLKEIDPTTGEPEEEGMEDDYPLEELDLSIGDYIVPTYVADFKKAWNDLGEDNEQVETYSLTAVASVKAAVTQVVDVLGMEPCENSSAVKDKATTHTLVLSGSFLGQVPALVRVRMALEPGSGVSMELAVRSAHEGVSLLLANAIE